MVKSIAFAVALTMSVSAVAQEITFPAGTPGVEVLNTSGRRLESDADKRQIAEIERAFRALRTQYEHGASIRDFVIGYTRAPGHPPTVAFMRIPDAVKNPDGSIVLGSPGRFYQVVVDRDAVVVIPRD